MSKSITFKMPDLYEDLADQYDVFEYPRDVLMFMAVLGYVEGEPKRDDYKGSDDNQGNTRIEGFYTQEMYQVFGGCLAYQDTGDPDALVDLELQAEVISQYAAGGLEIAQEEFGDVAGDPTDAIVNYINKIAKDRDKTVTTILKNIRQNFNKDMRDGEAD